MLQTPAEFGQLPFSMKHLAVPSPIIVLHSAQVQTKVHVSGQFGVYINKQNHHVHSVTASMVQFPREFPILEMYAKNIAPECRPFRNAIDGYRPKCC